MFSAFRVFFCNFNFQTHSYAVTHVTPVLGSINRIIKSWKRNAKILPSSHRAQGKGMRAESKKMIGDRNFCKSYNFGSGKFQERRHFWEHFNADETHIQSFINMLFVCILNHAITYQNMAYFGTGVKMAREGANIQKHF